MPASLEIDTFAIFVFVHLSIEYGYSLLHDSLGASTRPRWALRFDILRQGLCCVTLGTALLVACVWQRWYSAILVVWRIWHVFYDCRLTRKAAGDCGVLLAL